MHAVFMLYGKIEIVDRLIRDMAAQKHKLNLYSPDGKETKYVWMEGQVRRLPFGVYEYIFPKEDLDIVLTTLKFDKNQKNKKISKKYLTMLRKILKCKKIPKDWDKSKTLLWLTDNAGIIPIGIREDRDIIDKTESEFKGWTHEGI